MFSNGLILDDLSFFDPVAHSMGQYLFKYISIKVHPSIETFEGARIVVRGSYERMRSIISSKEKSDKLFNWKRPTAEFSKDGLTLYINCFPGIDYVCHYSLLIRAYLALSGKDDVGVISELPRKEESYNELCRSNLIEIPNADLVIFGKVENSSLFGNFSWQGNGDFLWSMRLMYGKRILFLGCRFSIWGDVAASLVRLLSDRKIKAFIYTGKLGGLHNDIPPNEWMATGNRSYVEGARVSWKNIIEIPSDMHNVRTGDHITLCSPMLETRSWVNSTKNKFSFVDPEVGHMARVAQQSNIDFGYIHLISDNVTRMSRENLSNERNVNIINKRENINRDIAKILEHTIRIHV